MKILSLVLAAALSGIVLHLPPVHSPAFAQAAKKPPKDPVASPELKKEFDAFIAKFRAALKANDAAAVAGMTKLPFMENAEIGNAAQFRERIYKNDLAAKERACIQRKKAVYARDGRGSDTFSIFCGETIFTFTRTASGFLFTDIGMND
jgi:hypothetical protein